VNPGSIKEDQLTSFHILDAKNSVSRGLRLFSDNGNFITQETIEEGRFPDIRPSQDRYKAGFECHPYLIADRAAYGSDLSFPSLRAAALQHAGMKNGNPEDASAKVGNYIKN
jgi:hypothetical protein